MFCRQRHLSSLPASVITVINFMASLADTNIAFRTAKVYLAGISNSHTEAGLYSPATAMQVKHAMKGYARQLPAKSDKRLPITMRLMRLLKTRIFEPQFLFNYDKCLYWNACTLAFFGFLRVSEFTNPSQTKIDVSKCLTYRKCICSRHAITIELSSSKSDQLCKGQRLRLAATNRSICPVRAFKRFLHASPPHF